MHNVANEISNPVIYSLYQVLKLYTFLCSQLFEQSVFPAQLLFLTLLSVSVNNEIKKYNELNAPVPLSRETLRS